MNLVDNMIDGLIAGAIGTACGAIIGATISYDGLYLFSTATDLKDVLVNILVHGEDFVMCSVVLGMTGFLGGTAYSMYNDLHYIG